MWKAMVSCAKQLFLIAEVGTVLGFQEFCEEQQCKNCASDKPEHKIIVVEAETHCIAPSLTPQKPLAEVL